MSDRFGTHRDIINAWPSLEAFAEDVGIPYETAKGMRTRSSIDSRYWLDVVSAADKRQFGGITLRVLATIAATKRPARPEGVR